jgi:hypothetical protein
MIDTPSEQNPACHMVGRNKNMRSQGTDIIISQKQEKYCGLGGAFKIMEMKERPWEEC